MTRTTSDRIHSQPTASSLAVVAERALPTSNLDQQTSAIRWVALFFALGFAALVAGTVSGQKPKYQVMELDEQIDKNLSAYQREASLYATAQDVSSIPENRALGVRKYFQIYVPSKITQPDATDQISEIMSHAISSMDRGIRSKTAGGNDVMKWLYMGLKPVAVGNYQPAARINAILFISRLARPPAQRGGLPQPYPFVLADMLAIYGDAAAPAAVRAAALQGLERFVRYTPPASIPAAAKEQLNLEMTKLLESQPAPGQDELVHAFLQRYAVNILSNLSTDATLGKQLVSLSTNESSPNLIALHSAAAIASLPQKMAAGDFETKEVLSQWSQRVLKAYESEVKRLKALDPSQQQKARQPVAPESFLKKKVEKTAATARTMMGGSDMMMDDSMYDDMMMDSSMMDDSMMGMDMMMMGGGRRMMGMTDKPQPAEIIASRKKLNHVLEQVLRGVTGSGQLVEDVDSIEPTAGLIAATPAESLPNVKIWIESINTLAGELNDRSMIERRAFVKALEANVESLKELAKGKAVVAREPIEQFPMGFGFGDQPAENAGGQPPAAGAGAEGAAANPAAEEARGIEAEMNALLNE
ncbi:hypothetical protein NHH03_19325 [Stieleria sp. TO1_6]|uniref:hypothetical protein n=1 Tax=Stieleria tagensis TaxID=2956795 RepID=UPI00209AB4A8|nr:hypothetical protein [Stieleria tagensis]MCO8123906.1 hypothetical protein [Stieleria tagensis]